MKNKYNKCHLREFMCIKQWYYKMWYNYGMDLYALKIINIRTIKYVFILFVESTSRTIKKKKSNYIYFVAIVRILCTLQ